MNGDLHFSATIYGIGGGLFLLSCADRGALQPAACEVRCAALDWRIMVTWGLLAMAMMLVLRFYVKR